MRYTSTTLFAGAGLMDCAIASTGGRVITAIEWDDRIAAQYAYNFPEVRLLVRSVQSLRQEDLDSTDHIHLSPPCTEASIANPKAVESNASISAAIASLEIIRSIHRRGGAKWITLENVWGYRHFQSFEIVLNGLRQLGYAIGYQKLNAADFGTPQNRERLWLRAIRADCDRVQRQLNLFDSGELLPIFGEKKKVSWWQALSHLEPAFPITELTAHQKRRLFNSISTHYAELPVLIKRAGANEWDRCIPSWEPAPTIRAGSGRCDPFDSIYRGIVRRLTPEALWLLQMYGCNRSYQWMSGTPNSLKCKAIGNGVAFLNAKAVLESLIQV